MRCIYCLKKQKTEVINSREIRRGYATWRRRACSACKRIFTTKESPVADNLFFIKRNGSRQRFVYEKLFASIFAVLNFGKKRDNGRDARLAKKIADRIVNQLFVRAEKKDISTQKVIELVYVDLKKINQAFANSYASYSEYRIKTLLQKGLMRIPEIYR